MLAPATGHALSAGALQQIEWNPEIDPSTLLSRALDTLPDRERTILSRRLERETLDSIAGDLKVTRERVRQLESKVVGRMSKYLQRWVRTAGIVRISQHIASATARNGGVASSQEIADELGWDLIQVRVALLLLTHKNALNVAKGDSDLRRQIVDLGIRHEHDLITVIEDPADIRALLLEIVGPSGVMRRDDVISALRRLKPEVEAFRSSEPDRVDTALSRIGAWEVVDAMASDRVLSGAWVTAGLTEHVTRIVSGLLYATDRSGVRASRTDQVVAWLATRFGGSWSDRAVDAVCERMPIVFVRTGARSWGLIGAGATENLTIAEQRTERLEHGAMIAMVTEAVMRASDGITEQEVLSYLRDRIPDASPSTVALYLNHFHGERFERGDDGFYRITDKYRSHLSDPPTSQSTIDLLTRLLGEASGPLDAEEIIARCELVQYVDHSAVLGYLGQNYRGLFRQLEDGRWMLA